jgi:proteic killer suppression protein
LTSILRTRQFEKDLEKVPEFIRVRAISWIEFVELIGILELRKRPGYHDEPLKGVRTGQRSVRMNLSYRLIYQERNRQGEILLLEITKHDY